MLMHCNADYANACNADYANAMQCIIVMRDNALY